MSVPYVTARFLIAFLFGFFYIIFVPVNKKEEPPRQESFFLLNPTVGGNWTLHPHPTSAVYHIYYDKK